MFVEMGDGFHPEIGGKSIVVEIESAVLVADGLDEARAGRPVVAPYRFPIPDSRFRFYWIECSDRSKNIRATVWRTKFCAY